jgi:hypothetical protein
LVKVRGIKVLASIAVEINRPLIISVDKDDIRRTLCSLARQAKHATYNQCHDGS